MYYSGNIAPKYKNTTIFRYTHKKNDPEGSLKKTIGG